MDRDELSRITAGILKMLVKATQQDRIDFDEDMAHEQIFYLLAPVLADAEKWRRIERAYNSSPPCDCPEWDGYKAECMIEAAHCPFNDVVNALEGEGEKG
jgi:hypothetical protein